MAKSEPLANIKIFVANSVELAITVRRIAKESGRVGFGNHSLERMEERGITRLDALRVLRDGDIRGDIEPGKSQGEWKCKMVMKLKGNREAGVISVVVNEERLFVKTVEWEDT